MKLYTKRLRKLLRELESVLADLDWQIERFGVKPTQSYTYAERRADALGDVIALLDEELGS